MDNSELKKFKEDLNNLFNVLVLNAEMAISDIKGLEQTNDIKKIKYSIDQILLSIEKGIFLNEIFQDYKNNKNIYSDLRRIQNKKSLKLLKEGLNKLKSKKGTINDS